MLRLALLLAFAWAVTPVAAFGAGNIASISKVEHKNWRHGDIEDVLLSLAAAQAYNGGKKFTKMMVSQTYFGNWARDYSQAIDVGTVKSISAEAIRLLLCILGFMTFGYGSGEFEVTAERLGCYRPEEHIDNPKNYADNVDARQYDRRLRGPVDEETELSIDSETGMKNYIANENAGIMTSAELIRQLFSRCIKLGRRYGERGDKKDLHESLRVLGTGLHCLEDFFAHSNYCELALIELGEDDIFPHVGRRTKIELEGARGEVYPLITGTFGGVDFLHSVTGEVSDKLSQNEIDELEGTLQESAKSDTSLLQSLLDQIPDGMFGDKHQSDKVDELKNNANSAQMANTSISPREPEEFTRYIQDAYEQVMPAITFHDDVMQAITHATESIPVLPKIIEQLEEQLSRFVFSLIAPFVVPLIKNIKSELMTGSNEIINSSEQEQHIVFEDDHSTDPTHSMLSKDHFSNILNELAGQCAAKTVHWVVPQLMRAIDDESIDIDSTLDHIVRGVMHHPAQREMGGEGAEEGRRQIFQTVEEWWSEMGDDQRSDYREKLSRNGVKNGQNHREGVYDTGHGHGCAGKLKMQKLYGAETAEDKIANAAAGAILSGATDMLSEAVGDGGSGGGRRNNRNDDSPLGGLLGAAGSLLSGALGGEERERRSDGNRQSSRRDEQEEPSYGGNSGYGRQESSYGGREEESSYGRSSGRRDDDEDNSYGRRQEESSYGRSSGRRDDDEDNSYGRRQESSGYGGREESSGYGGRQESSYGGGGGYGGREESSGYGRQESSYGGGGGYGDREESSYGGGGGGYGGRREPSRGPGLWGQYWGITR
ncbi:Heterokaryon incompatibility protein Het-C [Geosmithia morbida]|uniref:Heterokaryon incompatibility protein Het-C n=1 Tax=Geosmithia morbida TaxID=1094350 RepID=A0A9P4YYU0_9HYPO|nr:Heterokaryon incompatibility protein Het-C [Geosmithia morbida]KAF4125022.1 Heterokaryon incompatibility protein Het-C [Geosmithia morbida]